MLASGKYTVVKHERSSLGCVEWIVIFVRIYHLELFSSHVASRRSYNPGLKNYYHKLLNKDSLFDRIKRFQPLTPVKNKALNVLLNYNLLINYFLTKSLRSTAGMGEQLWGNAIPRNLGHENSFCFFTISQMKCWGWGERGEGVDGG